MTIRADIKSSQSRAVQTGPPARQGLYDPQFEHEACGVGFVVHIKGQKSPAIIQQALQVLLNLNHRGACGCEANTGDGAGILIQPPHEFLKLVAREARVTLPPAGEYGVGMVFLPQDSQQAERCEQLFEQAVTMLGQSVLGWRDVPVNPTGLGKRAVLSRPLIRQVFVSRGSAGAKEPRSCPIPSD